MSHYYPESSGVSRRAVVGGSIVGLHVLVVYLFATGLMHNTLAVLAQPIVASFFDVPRQPVAPSEPSVKLDPTKVDQVPLPPPPREPPDDPRSDPQRVSGPEGLQPAAQPPTVTALEPIRVMGQNRLPNTEDYYPADLRRLGVEGASIIRVCVDENGVREGNPKVEQSSGNPRLDQGALSVARAGRYARSMRGPVPVPNCFRFHIGFQMK